MEHLELLDVTRVAAILGTEVRFVRRLIEERRIEFVHVGRHVRIARHIVHDYIRANTVEPSRPPIFRQHLGMVA